MKETMSEPVVECVPNFSEGTDARRVEAIVLAMRVEGVHLLDWQCSGGGRVRGARRR
jgi:glutamate formiminotransferase